MLINLTSRFGFDILHATIYWNWESLSMLCFILKFNIVHVDGGMW
jgi:hypothetical protein